MRRIASVLIILLAVSFAVATGIQGISNSDAAELSEKKHTALKAGNYRELTFFRQLRLGAAPFVNPGLLHSTNVAYRHDIAAVKDILLEPSGKHAVMSGKAGFAKWNPEMDAYVVQSVEDIAGSFDAAVYKVLEAHNSGEHWIVLSQDPKALGEKVEAEPYVAWDAYQFVNDPGFRVPR